MEVQCCHCLPVTVTRTQAAPGTRPSDSECRLRLGLGFGAAGLGRAAISAPPGGAGLQGSEQYTPVIICLRFFDQRQLERQLTRRLMCVRAREESFHTHQSAYQLSLGLLSYCSSKIHAGDEGEVHEKNT